MTTPPTPSQPHPLPVPGGLLGVLVEWAMVILPPLRTALTVMTATDPLLAVQDEKHSQYGLPIAVAVVMTVATVLLLASDGAPFVGPFDALWTYKLEPHVVPSVNWPVLLWCFAYVVIAWLVAVAATVLAGLKLNNGVVARRRLVIRFTGYAALCAACAYLATSLLIVAIGWSLHFLKVYTFMLGWMWLAPLLVIPSTTFALRKVFLRTALPHAGGVLWPLSVSMAVIASSVISSIWIMNELAEASLAHGRTVNVIRNTPTAAVVQTCTRTGADIACAVTLFPAKWQDYELIGDWKLGKVVDAKTGHQKRFTWRILSEHDNVFPVVTLHAEQDTTVEIRITRSQVCNGQDTKVDTSDRFFAIQGRVRGQQRVVPQEMRLRIDNPEPGFVNMMHQACRV